MSSKKKTFKIYIIPPPLMLSLSRKGIQGLSYAPCAYFSAENGRVHPDQKFLVFFGAPGVGKGTYAKFVQRDFGFQQISTGDEIRKILKGQAAASFDKNLIAEINDIVKSGGLVSDEIVLNIVKEKLKEPESANGVILDGFPRNVEQLKKYDQLFPIDLVVNLNLKFEILLEKLMGRRTCKDCGRSYNLCSINRDGYEMDPLLPEKDNCDSCGGELIVRADDTEEVITERFKIYESQTLPLLQEYNKRPEIMVDFEVKRGVKDYPALKEILEKRLSH